MVGKVNHHTTICISLNFLVPANDLGPQRLFYIPEGVLNHNGPNTLSVGVIPLDNSTSLGKVSLETYGTLLSSKGVTSLVNSPDYDPATRF
jgi:hypothetical protein